jgi:hypothetical protein
LSVPWATGAELPDRGPARIDCFFDPSDSIRRQREDFKVGHPVPSGASNRPHWRVALRVAEMGFGRRFPAPGANANFEESSQRFNDQVSRINTAAEVAAASRGQVGKMENALRPEGAARA